jgi:hypothetical protein
MPAQALKVLYTVAALLELGLLATNVVPDSLKPFLSGSSVYLLQHSFLPSAKVGSPKG